MPAFIPHEWDAPPGHLSPIPEQRDRKRPARSSAGKACHSPLTAGFSIMKKFLSNPTARNRPLSASLVS